MKRCLITYAPFDGEEDYSPRGLKLLSPHLRSLAPLNYTMEEQRQQALERAGKMSIQGLQLKLSAVLRIKEGRFDLVDRGGRFILKPPSRSYAQLPENEDLSMHLAAAVGINVPLHGMVRARDGSLTFFVKRFDRDGHERLPQEDFAQLLGASRETKYDSSMEKVASVVESHCTFPAIEQVKLFVYTLFSYLIGNEDMHLKNFSLLTRGNRTDLAPAYDLVNSTLALSGAKEEMALPVRGKRARLTRDDLFGYYARERLHLNERVLADLTSRFQAAFPRWDELIAASFLSPERKAAYAAIVTARKARLNL